jgi:hypothetical protein
MAFKFQLLIFIHKSLTPFIFNASIKQIAKPWKDLAICTFVNGYLHPGQ